MVTAPAAQWLPRVVIASSLACVRRATGVAAHGCCVVLGPLAAIVPSLAAQATAMPARALIVRGCCDSVSLFLPPPPSVCAPHSTWKVEKECGKELFSAAKCMEGGKPEECFNQLLALDICTEDF